MRKIRVLTLLLLVVCLLPAALHSATLNEVLYSAVHADTYYGKDIDASAYEGTGTFILSAAKQGSGVSTIFKIQESAAPAVSSLNDTTAGDSWYGLLDAVATDTKLSVQWTQATAKTIKYVFLYLKQSGTLDTTLCGLTADIEADSGGVPSDVALVTSEVVDASKISASGEWVKFTFAVPYNLSASTVYHVVLTGTYVGSATNHIKLCALTVTSGGDLERNNGTWANITTQTAMAMGFCYSFTDVTSGAFTAVTNTAASFQNIQLNMPSLKNAIRGVAGVNGGTATGASSLILYGTHKYEP